MRGKLGKNARIWDLTSGRILHDLVGHNGIVTCSKFSPDGNRVVTGGTDATVRIWDVETGNQLQVIKGLGGSVFSVDTVETCHYIHG